VNAPAGNFQGLVDKDAQGNNYLAFRGIPYAKPPVGELRFAKPQPLDKQDGVFDATKGGNVCIIPEVYEKMIDIEQGHEDCLLLNIYARDIDLKSPKKVIFYIHGGGYFVGSGKEMHAGSFVTSQDVVFVTINYRLGVLGFLSTGDQAAPGNFGLWDMRMALKWVKENIASFGGDPSDVTISGESAGGSAVGYLSISPHTKGLFTKAYPQSGGPSSTFGRFVTPLKSTLKVAKHFNCFDGEPSEEITSESKKTVIACLREIPSSNFSSYVTYALDSVEFVPTIDNDFIPRSPLELLHDDNYLKSVGFFERSYLVGLDNNENSIFTTHCESLKGVIRQQEGMTSEEKEAAISHLLQSAYYFYTNSRFNTEVPKAVTDKIVDWYDRRFVGNTFGNLVGDLGFIVPTYDFINAASRGANTNVWLFHFNHYPKYMQGPNRGIIHALDLSYWFDLGLDYMNKVVFAGANTEMGMQTEDLELKTQLTSIIATFAQTGAPPKSVGGVSWPPYSTKTKDYLDFKTSSEVRQDLGRDVRRLWQEDVPRWMEEEQKSHQHTEL